MVVPRQFRESGEDALGGIRWLLRIPLATTHSRPHLSQTTAHNGGAGTWKQRAHKVRLFPDEHPVRAPTIPTRSSIA